MGNISLHSLIQRTMCMVGFSHVGLYVLHFHPPHSQPLSCKGEGGKNAPLIVRWLCGAGEYDWLGIGTNHPLSLGRGLG